MMTDTHSHLNFNAFKDDFEDVISRSLLGGVSMINVGSQYETSKRAIEIAGMYEEGVWASVGFHPIHAGKARPDIEEVDDKGKTEHYRESPDFFDYNSFKNLAKSEKVVAIGETGLDYWYKPKTKTKTEEFKNLQKEIFLKHIDLAQELNLPLILHCRMAHEDMLKILSEEIGNKGNNGPRGVIHCFTGTSEQARKYLSLGFYLGFNGIIFKLNLDETIKQVPLEKILVETDCPYLTPPQLEGRRNEPLAVKYVGEEMARIRGTSFEGVMEATTKNAQQLFKFL